MTESRQISHSILVVDDERGVRDVVCRALRKDGYEVVGAAGGDEALMAASRRRFDIVILDIRMPEMSGLTVLQRIKGQNPGQIAIMLTAVDADTQPEYECEARARGAFAYLGKPSTLKDLRDAVREALRKTRQLA